MSKKKPEEEKMKSYGECDGKQWEERKREGEELQEVHPCGPRVRSWRMKVISSFKNSFLCCLYHIRSVLLKMWSSRSPLG